MKKTILANTSTALWFDNTGTYPNGYLTKPEGSQFTIRLNIIVDQDTDFSSGVDSNGTYLVGPRPHTLGHKE